MDIRELEIRRAFSRSIFTDDIDQFDSEASSYERSPSCAPPIVRRPSMLPSRVEWIAGLPRPIEEPLSPRPSPFASLPTADCLVITWTRDEHRALARVFTPTNPTGTENDFDKWYDYRRDFGLYASDLRSQVNDSHPAVRTNRLGRYFLSNVGKKRVLLFKSELHMNQDGPRAYREGRLLPIVRMIQQLVREVKPTIVISTGTAGGTVETHNLGDTVISTSGVFHCGDPRDFRNADFNCKKYGMDYWISDAMFDAAAKMMVTIKEYAQGFPHPRYPATTPILISPVPPRIHPCPDLPIITTDFFEFGNTTNNLGNLGCAVEMGDALIAKAINEMSDATKPKYAFVRNVSDPVINGALDSTLQVMWAVYYYQTFGLQTSFNSSLATWAIIAGNQ